MWLIRCRSVASSAALAIVLACSTLSCTTAWLSAYNREQERKEALSPTRRESTTPPVASRIVRCRAYAGEGFRRQNIDWKREIQRQFDEANRILEVELIRLELTEVRSWDRSGGQILDDDLEALSGHDGGEDVDFVIGYVASLPLFTDSLHQLGVAWLGGRHGISRGIDDGYELEALTQQLQFSRRGEVEALYLRRVRHKKAVILIHEWAHAMGATHRAGSPEFLMKPTYGTDMARFSPDNSAVIEIAIRHRVGPAGDHDRWMTELTRYLDNLPNPTLEDQGLLAELRRMAGGGELRAADGTPWQSIQPEHHRALNAAIDAFNANRAAEAWTELAKIRESYRDDPEVQTLACQIGIAAPDVDGTPICELARSMARDDPRPAASLFAQATNSSVPSPEALALLREACDRVPVAPSLSAGWWAWFARLPIGYGGLSCAERALERVQDSATNDALTAAITEARNTFGLVPASPLTLTDELEIARAINEVDALLASQRLSDADTRAVEAAKRWEIAGTLAARCEVSGHQKRYSTARSYCEKALTMQPHNARATYLMAVLELRAGNQPAAQALLERSIVDAPHQQRAWMLLGQLYESTGRRSDLDRLRERFRIAVGQNAPF